MKSIFKKIAVFGVSALLCFGVVGAFGCSSESSDQTSAESESSAESIPGTPNTNFATAADPIGTHHAVIEIEGYDPITVELDGDMAPVTVQNFMDLANSGFYNGLTFHRIIEGFMMQGGDPLGNGTGGSGTEIVGEFSDNGYDNEIAHVRGTISMARSQDPNSASSQFFIVQEDSPFLDGQYAGFGRVTDGIEVVDLICKAAQPTDSNGTISADDQPVIKSITILD